MVNFYCLTLSLAVQSSTSSSKTAVSVEKVIIDLEDEDTCHWSLGQKRDPKFQRKTSSVNGTKASSNDAATPADERASHSGRSADADMKEYAMLCTVNDYFSFECNKGKYVYNYLENQYERLLL